MPCVLIEVRRQYSQEEEIELIEAVHSALRAAFLIPAGDRHVRLVVHEPHRFACPPSLEQPDRCTQVTIDAFAGRSMQAKRQLYQAIVTNLEVLGIRPDHVLITLREIPRENWGLRGGQAASDIDLGFQVEV